MAKKLYSLEKTINHKGGYPSSAPFYREAHSEALNWEKRHHPEGYKKLKKIEKKMKPGEWMGWHDRKGHVEISKRFVPKQNRMEVYGHEIVELKAEERLEREHKRKFEEFKKHIKGLA